MVVWLNGKEWNGFGFFGRGGTGKTALTFAFAERLLRDDMVFKIFDDNFLLEQMTIRPFQDWGSEDCLGKRTAFQSEVQKRCEKIDDFNPFKSRRKWISYSQRDHMVPDSHRLRSTFD